MRIPRSPARAAATRLLAIFLPLTFALPHALAAATLPYAESFTETNGAAWPSPWFAGSSHVMTWDVQSNRGRLIGETQWVARMILPGFSESAVEVEATLEFVDVHAQGIGIYVRQNGGTLMEYLPHGQGYAMFLKGAWAWPEDLGLWREIGGIETQFAWGNDPVPGGLLNGVRYRVRYRVTQANASTTLLQARVWPEGSSEPAAWTIEANDTRAELQGTAGSFAIDIWNHVGTNPVFIDDLLIRNYPYPADAPSGVAPARLELALPRPHPVNGPATLELALPEPANVALGVFDLAGRFVSRPFEGPLPAGRNAILWRATDARGGPLPAGAYVLRAEAGERRVTRLVIVGR